jgi:hypothetical protein
VVANGGSQREYLTAVTSPRSSLLQGLGLGLVLALIVSLSVDGDARWVLTLGCLIAGVGLARVWSPVESLWLEGAVLVQERRGQAVRVDLSQLASVKREWVPKKGDVLVVTDTSSARVAIWMLSDTTEQLRRVVGTRARIMHASTDLHDPKTKHLLFLD